MSCNVKVNLNGFFIYDLLTKRNGLKYSIPAIILEGLFSASNKLNYKDNWLMYLNITYFNLDFS